MSKDKSIKSPIAYADNYRKEHVILMEMYALYEHSPMVDAMSFSQYFDSLMKLDSARHNHEIHNFFKAEHNMQENFTLDDLDDLNDEQ